MDEDPYLGHFDTGHYREDCKQLARRRCTRARDEASPLSAQRSVVCEINLRGHRSMEFLDARPPRRLATTPIDHKVARW